MSDPPRTVSCLGPEGSFSHEFASQRYPDARCLLDARDFDEVLRTLEEGQAEVAVLPFLNSNGVDVRRAQAAISAARDWIWVEGCHAHGIVHNVVVGPGFKSLRRVISKEEVFPQCSTWLGQWEGIERVAASSTSSALKNLLEAPKAERESSAAICNRLAVDLHGGEIRWAGVQNSGNTTLFLVTSKRRPSHLATDALVCLTCPTEECYQSTVDDFAAAGMPLKFTSLRGEFTPELPCFLQFRIESSPGLARELAGKAHRTLIGTFRERDSLAACVGSFFDDI